MAQLITGVKTPEQLEAMREGGKRLAQIFADIRQFVHAGVSEKQIDAFTAERIAAYGAEPTYKTPEVNFPGVICISTNEAIVHGVPSDYILQRGDVVSFDLVITYQGMKTDSAFTMVVDDAPTGAIKHLLHTTERSLYAGIDAIKGPVRTGDSGAAVEAVLQKGRLGASWLATAWAWRCTCRPMCPTMAAKAPARCSSLVIPLPSSRWLPWVAVPSTVTLLAMAGQFTAATAAWLPTSSTLSSSPRQGRRL